jgi:hypothetical protein
VTALAAVIGITLYSTILNGVKIWERMDREAPMEDANIFFEKIAHELRNSFKFKSIIFRGDEREIAFPVISQLDHAKGGRQEIGRVRYVFDRKKGIISRGYQNYNQVVEGKEAPARELMAGVQSVEFSYYVYDLKEKQYLWVAKWQAEEGTLGLEEEEYLPVAVRIKIGILSDTGLEVLTRTISIPSGCCVEKGGGQDEAAVAL